MFQMTCLVVSWLCSRGARRWSGRASRLWDVRVTSNYDRFFYEVRQTSFVSGSMRTATDGPINKSAPFPRGGRDNVRYKMSSLSKESTNLPTVRKYLVIAAHEHSQPQGSHQCFVGLSGSDKISDGGERKWDMELVRVYSKQGCCQIVHRAAGGGVTRHRLRQSVCSRSGRGYVITVILARRPPEARRSYANTDNLAVLFWPPAWAGFLCNDFMVNVDTHERIGQFLNELLFTNPRSADLLICRLSCSLGVPGCLAVVCLPVRILSVQSMIQLKERKEMDEAFKKAQKPWAKLLQKVERTRLEYHTACKQERTAQNQERNATGDSSLSPDQIPGRVFKFDVAHSNWRRNMDLLLRPQNKAAIAVWVYHDQRKATKVAHR
ncbi:Protein kinase C and casein kinase substrate in neurons protein 2 [Eumeta japonica]|uniref:Protein kinase C and casein kinase substrate in neurons protein 2 n=1 Tax=Eumeta variegata TaxID=151549 RepID=A0A4C1VP58_EUMVA|nr:Protein kinase C and casein kinase substrate in neurons protein 2 [Eumeta japonica]